MKEERNRIVKSTGQPAKSVIYLSPLGEAAVVAGFANYGEVNLRKCLLNQL